MEITASSVVRARVSHARQIPVANRFVYNVDYLLLNERMLAAGAGPRLFAYGRPNLISLQPRDHGIGEFEGILGIRQLLEAEGCDRPSQMLLLTHPRYWGYSFNPVSFWLAFDERDQLSAVVAEVHNTFGDRHAYLCTNKTRSELNGTSWITASKTFHVSPFFDIVGAYRFRFLIDGKRISIRIHYDDHEGGGLQTSIVGVRRPFCNRELVRSLLRRPLGASRITGLIHMQALRLWFRGVRYRPRAEPPEDSVTR